MDLEFNYVKSDKSGRFSAHVEWIEGANLSRKEAYEAASAMVETLVCWKGWPHLDEKTPLPEDGWTFTMETLEAQGAATSIHVFTVAFQNLLDQLQFVSWWDIHPLPGETSIRLCSPGPRASLPTPGR